jgi:hypothetical protein
MNNNPQDTELEEIARQWNKEDFHFLLDLDVSIDFSTFRRYSHFFSISRNGFFVGQIADQEVEQQRQEVRRAAD